METDTDTTATMPSFVSTKLLLTPTEAAARLSISRSLLYHLIMHQRIFSVKVGGARRIPVRALQAYVDTLCTEKEAS
jgi:excisionase family DNA binding protein